MSTIYNLILLAFIVVFLIDESGIILTLKSVIAKSLSSKRGGRLYSRDSIDIRPLECSLCMTFWTGCIYLLTVGNFTLLTFFIVCLLSYLTRSIKDIYDLVQHTIDTIVSRAYKAMQ